MHIQYQAITAVVMILVARQQLCSPTTAIESPCSIACIALVFTQLLHDDSDILRLAPRTLDDFTSFIDGSSRLKLNRLARTVSYSRCSRGTNETGAGPAPKKTGSAKLTYFFDGLGRNALSSAFGDGREHIDRIAI
jgi:hypothetical protein